MTKRNFALKFISVIMIVVALFYYNQMAGLATELGKANEEIEKVVAMKEELEAQRAEQAKKAEDFAGFQENEVSGEASDVEDNDPEEEANYKEGTYEGVAQGYGGEVIVKVTVDSQEIVSIEVTVADNEDAAYYNMAIDIIPTIIETQSVEVDVVSGATYTSNGIIDAVKDALEKAVN